MAVTGGRAPGPEDEVQGLWSKQSSEVELKIEGGVTRPSKNGKMMGVDGTYATGPCFSKILDCFLTLRLRKVAWDDKVSEMVPVSGKA